MRKCHKCHNSFPAIEFKKSHHKYRCTKCQAELKKHSALKRKYGLTLDEYRAMVEVRKGECDICHNVRPLVVEHDHSCCPGRYTCGKCIRGLTCNNCNRSMGFINDDWRVAKEMYLYLYRSSNEGRRQS